jgi:hypothetical protein
VMMSREKCHAVLTLGFDLIQVPFVGDLLVLPALVRAL